MAAEKINISRLSDSELLEFKFSDLDLKIEGTWIEKCIKRLNGELSMRNISFKPVFFLADEWLTPDGEPVVGIPFYLASPRLMELESRIMKEVEGGTEYSCMRLLRHETGHALNYAYKLYRRRKWRELFGPFSADYPERYKYHPYSRSFVKHLDDYYAQYHPDEDFAETFAEWLNPEHDWRKKYAGWGALEKLEYVDRLMKEISAKPPRKRSGKKFWAIKQLKTTLKTYYKRKKDLYSDVYPEFHDMVLMRIFKVDDTRAAKSVHEVLSRYRKEMADNVAAVTGEKKYIINDLIAKIINRARTLKLSSSLKEGRIIHLVTAYITALTMNYYYTATFKKKKRK
ncbi:MAG: hypothetical protein JXJ19_00670 [Elusimicrobia bacterium]|nr:hypothetical protein [Elusimicrobiota bacterium]